MGSSTVTGCRTLPGVTILIVAYLWSCLDLATPLRVVSSNHRNLGGKMGKGMKMMGAMTHRKRVGGDSSSSSSKPKISKSSSKGGKGRKGGGKGGKGGMSSKRSGKGGSSSKSSSFSAAEEDPDPIVEAPTLSPTGRSDFPSVSSIVPGSMAPSDCTLGICGEPPFSIMWVTDADGIEEMGGWEVSNSGARIRFNIEDSANCGGQNFNEQRGTAEATIFAPSDYQMTIGIDGNAELQSSGFESMTVNLDGVEIISATSMDLGLQCAMGPPQVTVSQGNPIILTQGTHTFTLTFTTGDGAYHLGAFYEFLLAFEPV